LWGIVGYPYHPKGEAPDGMAMEDDEDADTWLDFGDHGENFREGEEPPKKHNKLFEKLNLSSKHGDFK